MPSDIGNTQAEPSRVKRADHEWLNSSGSVVNEIENATGYRYKSVNGWSFDYQVPGAAPGSVITMLALFGTKTQAINQSTQARAKNEDELEFIKGRFADLADGTWIESERGGPRYDEESVIFAVIEYLESKGKTSSPDEVRAKMAAAGGLGAYAKTAFTIPAVKANYDKLRGKSAATDADLV